MNSRINSEIAILLSLNIYLSTLSPLNCSRERAKAELSIDRLLAMNPMPYHSSKKDEKQSGYINLSSNEMEKDIDQTLSEFCWYRESDLDFSLISSVTNSNNQLSPRESVQDSNTETETQKFSIGNGSAYICSIYI